MAMKLGHVNEGIKVVGDLGDIQIAEVSDNEECEIPVHSKALSTIPNSLLQNSTVPVFGNISVSDSENVQFGNNTYFNGPVTIKQVIANNGVDNASYTVTDDEHETADSPKPKTKDKNFVKPQEFTGWIKYNVLGLSIGIFIIVLIVTLSINYVLYKSSQTTQSFTTTQQSNSSGPDIISPEYLRFVSRVDWLAQPEEGVLDPLKLPAPWVIITHTATEACNSQSQCVLRVRSIQTFHIESRGWYDIAYNFLVGGDGSVYYGRGWDSIGSHTLFYNKYSIGIAFIGTFNTIVPAERQLEACQRLIKLGIKLGKIAKDYKLLAHRQLMSTLSPGDTVFNIIKTWPHFVANFTSAQEILPNY